MIRDQLNRIEVKEYAEAITYVCTALASIVGIWVTIKTAKDIWKEVTGLEDPKGEDNG